MENLLPNLPHYVCSARARYDQISEAFVMIMNGQTRSSVSREELFPRACFVEGDLVIHKHIYNFGIRSRKKKGPTTLPRIFKRS